MGRASSSWRSRRVAPDADLSRVIDDAGHTVSAPKDGIIRSERLAAQLAVRPGDLIEMTVQSGRRETLMIEVAGTVTQYFGLSAYMDLQGLSALLRQSPQVSVANVTLDAQLEQDFHAALKEVPQLASTTMMTQTRRSFQDTIRQNVVIMTTIYITMGVLITVGVACNGARVQLSERSRELASLRILGYTRAEVSLILVGETMVLVGETMVLAVAAQPLGWLIGAFLARQMVERFSSDLYSVPLVLKPATFGLVSLIVLGAALGAALVVRRRLDRMGRVQF